MTRLLFAPLALLFIAGCSQSNETNATETGAVVADTVADGTPAEGLDMAILAPASGDTAATRGSKQAKMKMVEEMPAYTGDADVDFNRQMRNHHLAAIDMAEVQLANGKDSASSALAQKIITDQKREVARIDAWLQKRST